MTAHRDRLPISTREGGMAYYLVSYDLHKERDYKSVWSFLELLNGVRLLESVWLVDTELNAFDLRVALEGAGDSDDSFAIIEIKRGVDWTTHKGKQEGADFLHANIKRLS
jgi:hypothetical protein